MKLVLPTFAIFASLAVAKNCNKGLNYCALTLLNKGDYHQQILGAVDAYGLNSANYNYDYFLYECKGGSNGDIQVKQRCTNGCKDGGSGKSDSCK